MWWCRGRSLLGDFVVWLDLGQKECSVFGGGTGGMGTCDGIVMVLGIAALAGARGSHYILLSEGITRWRPYCGR